MHTILVVKDVEPCAFHLQQHSRESSGSLLLRSVLLHGPLGVHPIVMDMLISRSVSVSHVLNDRLKSSDFCTCVISLAFPDA